MPSLQRASTDALICRKQVWSLIIIVYTTVRIIQLHIHVHTTIVLSVYTSLDGENEKATSQLVAGEGLSAEPFSCCWNEGTKVQTLGKYTYIICDHMIVT